MQTIKINEVEVSIEQIKKVVKEHPELFKGEEKKSRYFKPEIGDNYHYISNNGVYNGKNENIHFDEYSIERGVFRTKEEAELEDKKRLALVRLWNYADEHMYFRPDWGDWGQRKYCLSIFFESKDIIIICEKYNSSNISLPFFKSVEDGEKFVKDNKEDILLVSGV